jgi:hypothetical protein
MKLCSYLLCAAEACPLRTQSVQYYGTKQSPSPEELFTRVKGIKSLAVLLVIVSTVLP